MRSSVSNLLQFNSDITHESFTDAVVAEFRKAYEVSSEVILRKTVVVRLLILLQVCIVDDSLIEEIEFIRHGMSELLVCFIYCPCICQITMRPQTWDCMYAQTPEFTRSLSRTFGWGKVVSFLVNPILLRTQGRGSDNRGPK